MRLPARLSRPHQTRWGRFPICPLPSYNRKIENHLLTRELELLNPTPESLSTLLAEDFQEFGSSGRIYTRSEAIESLQTNPRPNISIADFKAKLLTKGIALVTYQAIKPEGISLRSSLWVIREGRWQILFHQGTRARDLPEFIGRPEPMSVLKD